MYRHLKQKLRSRAGETIAEPLVALWISALALVMLAGAISAGTRIIIQSENTMQAYYQENNTLATPGKGTDGTTTSPASISITDSESKPIKLDETGDISVKYSKNVVFGSKPVVAYVK